jgi:hypothetical protein
VAATAATPEEDQSLHHRHHAHDSRCDCDRTECHRRFSSVPLRLLVPMLVGVPVVALAGGKES